jgi:hypothetical protein
MRSFSAALKVRRDAFGNTSGSGGHDAGCWGTTIREGLREAILSPQTPYDTKFQEFGVSLILTQRAALILSEIYYSLSERFIS